MKYILYIVAIISLTACSTDSPVMGPIHNYEVPDTLSYVITEDGASWK